MTADENSTPHERGQGRPRASPPQRIQPTLRTKAARETESEVEMGGWVRAGSEGEEEEGPRPSESLRPKSTLRWCRGLTIPRTAADEARDLLVEIPPGVMLLDPAQAAVVAQELEKKQPKQQQEKQQQQQQGEGQEEGAWEASLATIVARRAIDPTGGTANPGRARTGSIAPVAGIATGRLGGRGRRRAGGPRRGAGAGVGRRAAAPPAGGITASAAAKETRVGGDRARTGPRRRCRRGESGGIARRPPARTANRSRRRPVRTAANVGRDATAESEGNRRRTRQKLRPLLRQRRQMRRRRVGVGGTGLRVQGFQQRRR